MGNAPNLEQSAGLVRTLHDDNLCELCFDRPDSSANIFDASALAALDAHLAALEQDKPGALVFTSAKPTIFIAGADLQTLSGTTDPAELAHFIDLGQEVMNRIDDLPFPTVAAIHGACVGGGYELALACRWRVATPDKSTKIGLPETKLGILPAWGGSTRLPKLIGLPKALDIILGGKTVTAKHAVKLGMIDAVVPREHLLKMARNLIKKGRRKTPHFAANNGLSTRIIAKRVAKRLETKLRGHYPAVTTALDVAAQAPGSSREASLAREREAVSALAQTPQARNLIRLFLMQEAAKKRGAKAAKALDAGRPEVAVIGAGVMGAGIAQWLASRGLEVTLCDIAPDRVASGMQRVEKLFDAAVKRRLFSAHEARAGRDRITPTAERVPLHRADLVIEAATEDLDLKGRIFKDLAERMRPDALLATNTSALPVGRLAADMPQPERVLGLHFFNPVHAMPLVEIVAAETTSDDSIQRALAFIHTIGKQGVVVRDHPGFLVNRILMPGLLEAAYLFDQRCPAEKIDEALLEFGLPMGGLRLIDEVGLDVARHVAETLRHAFGERLAGPDILRKMVEAGWLGRKSGAGFYTYGKKDESPNAAALSLRATGDADRYGSLGTEEIADRVVLPMINEAARCLEEAVARGPEDVDLAMVLGAGFAPFRGGVLRYADSRGTKAIVEKLETLARRESSRESFFAPCERLQTMAASGASFYSPQT